MAKADGPCKDCIYWEKISDSSEDTGICSRYPPKPSETGNLALWPKTKSFDWCGEYEPKEAADRS
jgi:hypothetical protein